MRVGLIARGDSRGLGVQTKAFHDNMHPTKTLVVDCPSQKPLPLRRDWYPGATWIKGLPTAQDYRQWLRGLDVVYTAETGYNQALWSEADRQGVKTVLHANYEFLNHEDQPTQWWAPSTWHFEDYPRGAQLVPVPIETNRFATPAAFPSAGSASRFLHLIGRPAIVPVNGAQVERSGTRDLLAALRHVRSSITLTIRCQESGYAETLARGANIPRNVKVIVESGDLRNYWDAYRDQDVLVLPRRWGGLSLPTNEALGGGIPVIMPRISPNNRWLPGDWLTDATPLGTFKAKTRVTAYTTNPRALAAKIDQFATDTTFYRLAQKQAQELAAGLSWDTMKPVYEKVLTDVLC